MQFAHWRDLHANLIHLSRGGAQTILASTLVGLKPRLSSIDQVLTSSSSPSSALLPPTKLDRREKKGTLILTSQIWRT